jgi:hypothetical protein
MSFSCSDTVLITGCTEISVSQNYWSVIDLPEITEETREEEKKNYENELQVGEEREEEKKSDG